MTSESPLFAPIPGPTLPFMMTNGKFSGDDLRLLRLHRRLTATAVARCYGATRTRISGIERQDRPTTAAVGRYLEALRQAEAATQTDDPTITEVRALRARQAELEERAAQE